MRKAWATLFVITIGFTSLFAYYWIVSTNRPTLAQQQRAICELAQVVYDNTIDTASIAQDVIDDAIHQAVASHGFYVELRRLESLPCNLRESP